MAWVCAQRIISSWICNQPTARRRTFGGRKRGPAYLRWVRRVCGIRVRYVEGSAWDWIYRQQLDLRVGSQQKVRRLGLLLGYGVPRAECSRAQRPTTDLDGSASPKIAIRGNVLRTGRGLAATTNRIAPGTSQLEHASAYSTLGAQMPLFSLAPYLPWCKWQALSAAAATILMPCIVGE